MTTGTQILKVTGMAKSFGGLKALDCIDFTIFEGEIVSLIGPNGSGKTTLFNCLSGFYVPDAGNALIDTGEGPQSIVGLQPHEIRSLGLARTFQTREIFHEMSIMDSMLAAMHPRLNTGFVAGILQTPAWRNEEETARKRVADIFDMFPGRFTPDRWNQPCSSLSYANRCRLEIAMCLASEPKIILTDEPAAGMNPVERVEIMNTLKDIRDRGYTLIVVEHNMRLVLGVSDRIIVFDRGRKIADGRPDDVVDDPRVSEAYLGKNYDVA